ncbi:MAG: hypothetical protein NTZ13_04160 [Candidatus Parcubacteria bacterium]|nr:hypothetical protein [Candidatus Parcubacteria bacterium]
MTQNTQSKLMWILLGILLSPFILWFFIFYILPSLFVLLVGAIAFFTLLGAWIVVGVLIIAFLFMATAIHPQ